MVDYFMKQLTIDSPSLQFLEADSVELCAKLRRLRHQAQISTRALAERTGFSQSKISKIENGYRSVKPADVYRILEALGVRPKVRDSLVAEAARLRRASLSEKKPDRPDFSFIDFRDSEEIDRGTKDFYLVMAEYVPLWFQTDAYSEFTYRIHRISDPLKDFMRSKTVRKVASESGRQRLCCIVDERVLHRPMLDPSAWFAQLERLKERLNRPGAELGIVPIDAAPALVGSWTLHGSDSVMLEPLNSPGLLVSDPKRVQGFADDFETWAAAAEWGGAAIGRIDDAIARLSSMNLRPASS